GFVGFAERGPLPPPNLTPSGGVKPDDLAIRLTSWKEYTTVFGGFIPYGSLAYAVRAFFENGGTTCYVVRVAATNDPDLPSRPRVASTVIPDGSDPQLVAVLTGRVSKGETDLVLSDASKLGDGDLIAIVGEGVTEFGMVIGTQDNRITLGHKTLA